jgi:bifunctional UDP-N-acetylglucosamine pyrophosphorylase/glucosamine-1-phosphate N-acetyltransferase
MEKKVKIVILAAGKGVRMQSPAPKVLAPLRGKHMIKHLLDAVDKSDIDEKPIIVVGYERELVKAELGDKYEYVVQEEQLGSAHAVLSAKEACGDAKYIIVLAGDQPFIKSETLKNLLAKHLTTGAKITISTTELPDFSDWREVFQRYGRIIRENGKIVDREYKDASGEEREIKEVNVSCYAFDADWLWENIDSVSKELNAQKEFYLTDLWQIASTKGDKIESIQIDPREALGANSKEELEILEKMIQ